MTDVFINRPQDKLKLIEALKATDMPYRVKITKGGKRSLEQNAYLWGVVYETILTSGLKDQGWRADDLHEWFLGECYGWKTLDGFGRKRMKPLKRSSGRTKMEFMDYIAFIQEKMAEQGVYIPDPNEELAEAG